MNKKVYVLVYSDYEGFKVVAVYDTLEAAKDHEKALEDLASLYRAWNNEHDVWQGYTWNDNAEKEHTSFEERFVALGVSWSFSTSAFVCVQEHEVKRG